MSLALIDSEGNKYTHEQVEAARKALLADGRFRFHIHLLCHGLVEHAEGLEEQIAMSDVVVPEYIFHNLAGQERYWSDAEIYRACSAKFISADNAYSMVTTNDFGREVFRILSRVGEKEIILSEKPEVEDDDDNLLAAQAIFGTYCSNVPAHTQDFDDQLEVMRDILSENANEMWQRENGVIDRTELQLFNLLQKGAFQSRDSIRVLFFYGLNHSGLMGILKRRGYEASHRKYLDTHCVEAMHLARDMRGVSDELLAKAWVEGNLDDTYVSSMRNVDVLLGNIVVDEMQRLALRQVLDCLNMNQIREIHTRMSKDGKPFSKSIIEHLQAVAGDAGVTIPHRNEDVLALPHAKNHLPPEIAAAAV